MEEKESTKITIPPLSVDEEGKEIIMDLEGKVPHEEVAESVDPVMKFNKPTEGWEKGVLRNSTFLGYHIRHNFSAFHKWIYFQSLRHLWIAQTCAN